MESNLLVRVANLDILAQPLDSPWQLLTSQIVPDSRNPTNFCTAPHREFLLQAWDWRCSRCSGWSRLSIVTTLDGRMCDGRALSAVLHSHGKFVHFEA
jgi:hypothetical protein